MKLRYFLPFLAFVGGFALANPGNHEWHNQRPCLSDTEAKTLVDVMVSLSHSFDPAYVTPFLTDDFKLQSDSINWILGIPSGTISYDDKDVLIAIAYNFTVTYPELNPPITVSFVMHSCTDIAYRSVTVEAIPVQGIHIIRTRYEHGKWKIYLSYDEFNSAADVTSLGVNCTLPAS